MADKHPWPPRSRPLPATPQPQPPIVRTSDEPSARRSHSPCPKRTNTAAAHLNCAPCPRPSRGPPPPVVVTFVDVQPIYDKPCSPMSVPGAAPPASALGSSSPLPLPLETEPPLTPRSRRSVAPSCGQGGGPALFPGLARWSCCFGAGRRLRLRQARTACRAVPTAYRVRPDTAVGRFLCGVYDCICCPDPATNRNGSRWLTSCILLPSRPDRKRNSRLRWDSGFDLNHPDVLASFSGRGPTARAVAPTRPTGTTFPRRPRGKQRELQ